jgi:hypothetical protein
MAYVKLLSNRLGGLMSDKIYLIHLNDFLLEIERKK